MALGLAYAEALGSPLTTDQLPQLLYLGTPVILHLGWFAHSNDCTSQLPSNAASCSDSPRSPVRIQKGSQVLH